MDREEAFEFLDRTARGIAEMFGPACETLVHDMSLTSHPVLAIYNGHVSGREVGSTTDILGYDRVMDAEAYRTDFVNLLATTPTGQQIKSSTFHLIGEDYNLALGINFDFTALSFASRTLTGLMRVDSDLQSAMWRSGDSQLDDVFEECVAAMGRPVEQMGKAERLRLVALLNQRSAFSFRKSVPFVAKRLGVSRYTVYKYLDEITQEGKEEEG